MDGNGNIADFVLERTSNGVLIGTDREGLTCAVVTSSTPTIQPQLRKTNMLSVECNVPVVINIGGQISNEIVHILRCHSTNRKEISVFIELVSSILHGATASLQNVIDAFDTIQRFFANKREPTDNELIGLYAELYTILTYHDSLGIERFWQSKDRMKFDFSFTEKLKIEVKATTRSTRTHHFRHEQLMKDLYDVYVISYMLRYDDAGLSLFSLIENCKPLLKPYSSKLMRLLIVQKNVSEERLQGICFNTNYTEENKSVFSAVDIPKFNQSTPDGVSNAEYDCVLDNATPIEESVFVADIISTIQGTDD